MVRDFTVGPPIRGKRAGGDVVDERRYFYTCPTCGKPVDMRDLRQVMLHETPGHAMRRTAKSPRARRRVGSRIAKDRQPIGLKS
ncbi:hypothetical protein DPM35_13995 [Mesorhizobium atlanticum]|uniref:Uncharacterized protein n=2 Tax=Mesorhizobium atlanticum TaxID=2233532 RepID=A0A330GV09_9HYPH|nr:hypothetical protein DPM35_13995 [Mesorhizobium atlanticum]